MPDVFQICLPFPETCNHKTAVGLQRQSLNWEDGSKGAQMTSYSTAPVFSNGPVEAAYSHRGESLRGTSWKAPREWLSVRPDPLGCALVCSMSAAGLADAEACALNSALTAPLMLPVLAAAQSTHMLPCQGGFLGRKQWSPNLTCMAACSSQGCWVGKKVTRIARQGLGWCWQAIEIG